MMQIATTLEQSRRLLELGLDPQTADMYIFNLVSPNGKVDGTNVRYIFKEDLSPFTEVPEIIPAWSLTALVELLPKHYQLARESGGYFYCHHVQAEEADGYETPVEATYQTICALLENGYIKN